MDFKDNLILFTQRANIITLLLVCSCANTNGITGSWRVIDGDIGGINEYRTIYTFIEDSIIINELGIGSNSYPVKYSKSKIYVDTALEFNYHIQGEKLVLSKAIKTIPGQYDSMTLIPFRKKSLDAINIDSLKSILTQYSWSIMLYDSWVTLRTSFYDSLCYGSAVCPADVFNFHGQQYNRSMGDDVYWWIADFKGQLFLIIEDATGDIYPTVYMIISSTTDKLAMEYAWYGEQNKAIMIRGDIIKNRLESQNIRNQLIGTWEQKNANFVKQNVLKDDDSTGDEFIRFSVAFFSPDSNIVYKESDFHTNDLRVEFKENGNFKYYLEEKLMCEGDWLLSKDTHFVKMKTIYDFKNFEKYTPECNDIFLEYKSNDSIVFQQKIPYFHNDTLVLEETIRFFMKRAN